VVAQHSKRQEFEGDVVAAEAGTSPSSFSGLHLGCASGLMAIANSTDTNSIKAAWKNNLYADGHAESKRPDEVIPRWSLANPAIW
jgi:prepilin-type processing-associated H-X9-DG protein